MDERSLKNLQALSNPPGGEQLPRFAGLCKPAKVTVLDESKGDVEYTRKLSLSNSEETPLKMRGHTIHFDGYYDLARDTSSTKVLTPPSVRLSKGINTIDP